jgi:hypothetical protein
MARRSPWPEGGALKPELIPAAGLPEGVDVVLSSTMTEAQLMGFYLVKTKHQLERTRGRQIEEKAAHEVKSRDKVYEDAENEGEVEQGR